ncbi:MAG: DUF2330 domain-containing protein [Armatimonadetes bacterium]|nr:DUF2330 domain-containing protein [Armatimonadota bacterium]
MRFVLPLALVASLVSVSGACGGFGVKKITFLGQNNIVLYNAKTKMEHFVRQATFEKGDGDSMGFVAPTPSVPKFGEAKPFIFTKLFSILNAAQDREANGRTGGGGFGGAPGAKSPKVLSVTEVAGYQATVLKASDTRGLAEWLEKNGYTMQPGMQDWLDHYVKKDWYFTAFKVKKQADGYFRTGLVRMSFKTSTPYNPYFVPKANRGAKPGGLQVLYLDTEVRKPSESTLRKVYSTPIPRDERAGIAWYLGLSPGDVPSGLTLTSYSDPKFPRAGTDDVFFRKD